MKTKKKVIKKSGSVKIEPAVLQEAKKICPHLNQSIQEYVTEAVQDRNKTEKREIVWA